jgi:hypothetical protein
LSKCPVVSLGIRYLPAVIVQSHVMAAGVIQFLVWEDYAPIEHKKGTISGYTPHSQTST